MSFISNKLITDLKIRKVNCHVYNPQSRDTDRINKNLNDLLQDDTISGATISEITLTMIKKFAIKAEEKENKSPQYNNPMFNSLGGSSFMRLLNDIETSQTFIQDYDVEKILSEAIGEALTQKALEENNT